jgi:hypothetical protein
VHNDNAALKAIGGQLDEIERRAKVQRTVMRDFAHDVNLFVSSLRLEEHIFAQDLCSKVIAFLTASLQVESPPARLPALKLWFPRLSALRIWLEP